MDDITLRIIVNCGPGEEYIGKCLASIRSQSFANWKACVNVDPWGDTTFAKALLAVEEDPRIQVHQNQHRQYAMLNLIQGIRRSGAGPEDVIVVLDGDDWFATPHALRVVYDTYKNTNCWMTYGSWVSDQPAMVGMWPAYPDHTTDFRNSPWLGTAVRTWKRWLWDLIDDRDLRDCKGDYLCVTEDQAVMLPMLEMSGTANARHIPDVLMVYNRSSPHACCYTRRDEMLANEAYIRKRPPYARLAGKPDAVDVCA
jgi:hypothetical protein